MINRSKFKSTHAHTGFNLTEMVVVIGIVAILVVVLIPTLSAVRSRSDNVTCHANLRAIGMAFNLFAMDNNGEFHGYVFTNFGRGDPSNSPSAPDPGLGAYLELPPHPRATGKNTRTETVLCCKASNEIRPSSDYTMRTYAVNRETTSDHRSTNALFSKPAEVTHPEKMAYMMDGPPISVSGDGWYYGLASRNTYIPDLFFPHSNKTNVIFLDGHIESLSLAEIKVRASSNTSDFWIGSE